MEKLYLENIDHECYIGEYPKSKTLNFVYSHGKLEHMVGYDILRYDPKNHFDRRRNYNGMKCIAVLPDGTEISARLFFWHTVYIHHWENWGNNQYRTVRVDQHGLLVAADDKLSIKDARKKFKRRATGV